MILNLVKTIKGVTLFRSVVNTFVFILTGFPKWEFGKTSKRVSINTLTYTSVPVHLVKYRPNTCIPLCINTHTEFEQK